jgi:hypothetical protein
VRAAVCDKTFKSLQSGAYSGHFAALEPLKAVAPEAAQPFNCAKGARRHPKETKGQDYVATTEASICIEGSECC